MREFQWITFPSNHKRPHKTSQKLSTLRISFILDHKRLYTEKWGLHTHQSSELDSQTLSLQFAIHWFSTKSQSCYLRLVLQSHNHILRYWCYFLIVIIMQTAKSCSFGYIQIHIYQIYHMNKYFSLLTQMCMKYKNIFCGKASSFIDISCSFLIILNECS